MCNGCVADLDAKVFALFLENPAGELGPIVNDDLVWDPEPTDDRLDELNC
jgi:hypothetical protein